MTNQQNQLQSHLKNLIKINGAISVADFINEALFNKKYGYYQKKLPIGKKGDFITAPEISQVFGELIAAYFLNFFSSKYPNIDKDFTAKISLVEMGAGNATLMKDILTTIKKFADREISAAKFFLKNVQFNIIETSPALQKQQKKNLQKILGETKISLSWYESFAQFKAKNKKSVIYFVANELFDCFAIHQFIKRNNSWHEIKITWQDEKFVLFDSGFNEAVNKIVQDLVTKYSDATKAKYGAIFEHSFSAGAFMNELSDFIKQNSGLALIIDYGYFYGDFSSSLQALQNHQKQDIFYEIGNSDLTSLVNFYYLHEIAKVHDLQCFFSTQRDFLLALGIEKRRDILLQNKNQKQQEEINNSINRLIDKDQMGELFKCLEISK